jgi:hypothetical protein
MVWLLGRTYCTGRSEDFKAGRDQAKAFDPAR